MLTATESLLAQLEAQLAVLSQGQDRGPNGETIAVEVGPAERQLYDICDNIFQLQKVILHELAEVRSVAEEAKKKR